MRLTNILQLGVKELRGLARDPMMLFLVAYAFTVAVYTEATATPEALNKAAIAIVDEDQSPLSARITGVFYPPYFTIPVRITPTEMDRRMDAGLDTFALDIPPNFQRDLLAGRSPTIQLNVDATRMTQAFSGSGYIQSIIAGEVRDFSRRYHSAASEQVDLDLRMRFNANLTKSWFGAVTSIINNVTMLAVVLTGAALIREREHGTIEHLLVMPVTPVEIMLSKIWSMGLVVFLVSCLSLVVVVQGVMAVPIQGSIGLFALAAALDVFATTGLGIALATLAGSMPRFGLLMVLVLLPLQVLSGSLSPRESMPEFVRTIMLAAPNTHFVTLAQSILFRGAGFEVVWPQFLALAAIGAVLFAISLRQFRAFLK
ncbi:ABC-2 type transport system permease protein [Enhydrobacter aerosaccus]|uniref:ABC-2 type transport system permease protein n=1 Tax=Enhydrobacter aerosaccus TaxID=225324 RepID=A0A1T4TJ41_9HYPH|nr:ABC transporter permease [Enhydrobacter aerosaccus]SKA40467.1 ABC-2 type transport system permease protein [Enhydrobacter aerosaccus]